MSGKVRLIAFYLPQFHPIPENDAWWGKGFTEWTNVTKAKPLFRGHYQPHLPSDLGFYDLRQPEARQAQADLAKEYGIYGFCYYDYWFHGRRLLERPFQEVLASGKPDFPFCLCWCNEDWTAKWNSGNDRILMKQTYSADDDRQHIRGLISAFKDPRYIKIDGRPLFLVYRAHALPDSSATAKIWREEAAKAGLPGLYLCWALSHDSPDLNRGHIGFDAAVDFHPAWIQLQKGIKRSFLDKIHGRILGKEDPFSHLYQRHYRDYLKPTSNTQKAFPQKLTSWYFKKRCKDMVYDYATVVQSMTQRPEPDFKLFPGAAPSYDSSPRRSVNYGIFKESSPELYEQWLRSAILSSLRRFEGEARIVFVFAWNEWAEGCHLEPDQKWGRKYLESTRAAIESTAAQECPGSFN
jgi:lipopolysaccharide biosynthesis protein